MTSFFPLPVWLMRRSDVSWPAKVLFAVLVRYTRKGTREAYPAIDTLVRDMASPRRSVERWLGELEHAGLLERERTGRACTFRMAIDPGAMTTDGGSAEGATPANDGGSRSATDGASGPPSSQARSAKRGVSDPPSVAHQALSTPSSVGVEISIEGERAREWRVGYARRWESACGAPAPSIDGYVPKLLRSAADPVRALDGFFATPRMRKTRPPFDAKYLADNPEGFAACASSGSPVSDPSTFEPEDLRGIA